MTGVVAHATSEPGASGRVAGRRDQSATSAVARTARRASGPLLTVLLSTVAMAQALRVWDWRLGTPLDLDGDGAFVLMQVKDILDHGWYWANPDVGAPFRQTSGWFSDGSWAQYLVVKLLGVFSSSPATVSALFFFLAFPMSALAAYWLARRVGIARSGAVTVGVLFSVLPGHQLQFPHLWLAAYYVVPLGLWLVLVVADILRNDPIRGARTHRLGLAAVVIVVGLGGVYYAAFTLLLMLAVLVVSIVAGRGSTVLPRSMVVGGGLAGVCLVPLAAAVAQSHGDQVTGMTAGSRGYWQSEIFAGKIVDLVLPWIHHRVPGAAQLTTNYSSVTIPSVEQPALGVVALAGACGVLLIGMALLLGRPHTSLSRLVGVLTVLTLTAIALFTRGGLGVLVAIVVTPSIRTWSRLVVVIGLLGLLGVGLLLTVLRRRHQALTVWVAAVLLITVGVLDQTNPAMAPPYAALRASSAELASYGAALERAVGAGCAVFQLPVVPFPEQVPPVSMTGYEQLRPYVFSSRLRWSYGAMRGTPAADWQLALPALGADGTLVDDLASAGFCAVELDTAGVNDPSADLKGLGNALGPHVASTADGRLVAFDLRSRRAALVAANGEPAVERRGESVLHRVPAGP